MLSEFLIKVYKVEKNDYIRLYQNYVIEITGGIHELDVKVTH